MQSRVANLSAWSIALSILISAAVSDSEAAPIQDPQDSTLEHTWVLVAAGALHTCGLTGDGAAYCWGSNTAGQLGAASPETCDALGEPQPCSTVPQSVAGGLRFESLSAAGVHSCGVTAEGDTYCWGQNDMGQLGTDAAADECPVPGFGEARHMPCSRTPVRVKTDIAFASVEIGFIHTCALTAEGAAYCWGANGWGQLGSDASSQVCSVGMGRGTPCQPSPIPVDGTRVYADLTVGPKDACGVTAEGATLCWGANYGGSPTAVAGEWAFTQISAGSEKVCAATVDLTAYCWGVFNAGPSLSFGTEDPTRVGVWGGDLAPDQLELWRFASVSTGGEHACGLTPEGTAYCWGNGNAGQLGTAGDFPVPDEKGSSTPMAVAGELNFKALSTGHFHTCGVTSDGRAYCWGWNGAGQLGMGSSENRDRPEPVTTPKQAG